MSRELFFFYVTLQPCTLNHMYSDQSIINYDNDNNEQIERKETRKKVIMVVE
jgi:hypothetical protein